MNRETGGCWEKRDFATNAKKGKRKNQRKGYDGNTMQYFTDALG